MYTIKEAITYQEIIKKSKFITYLHPVNSLNEAKEIIKKYQLEHKEATHVCYSYIIDENTYKYYDDGEPSNSAGMPIYQVLKNNKLIYIVCVIVRYFGGVKLGVGGLCHAYSSGALNSLKNATVIEYKKTDNYIIEISYPNFDIFNYYLEKKGIAVIDKQFLDNIYISIFIDEDTKSEIDNQFSLVSITKVE